MIISCRYGDISIPAEKDLILTSLRYYGEWAQIELDVLANFVSSGNVVIDAGAFIGTHSLAFATMAGTKGQVHAFEPNSAVYPFLEENAANSPDSNVIPYSFALGAKNEYRIVVDNWVGGNQGALHLECCKEDNTRPTVNVKSVDSLNIGRVDFIKADVEGMELEILAGAAHTIDVFKPIIFMEVNSLDASSGVLEWANKMGFIIYGVITAAFNPRNYNSVEEDLFDHGKECGLLLIHSDKSAVHLKNIERLALPEIQTVDDIALLLLHKPQYPYEILEKNVSSKKLGIGYCTPGLDKIVRNHDSQVAQLTQVIGERDNQLADFNQELGKRDGQLEDLTQVLEKRDGQLENLYDDLGERNGQIAGLNQLLGEQESQFVILNRTLRERNSQIVSILTSRSWLLTKPLRFLDSLLAGNSQSLTTLIGCAFEKKQTIVKKKDERIVCTELQGLFDASFYLQTYPDVAELKTDPLTHYLTVGWQDKRNPNPYFDANYYLLENPDIASANINPLQHYIDHGWREGRNPSACFDTAYYLTNYPDIVTADINPLQHYIEHGCYEGRNPYPFFDANYYLEKNPDICVSGKTAFRHFMEDGWREGRSPGVYFDTEYYLAEYPDVAAAAVNPLIHFVTFGWLEGRNPNPYFDTSFYLSQNPDIAGTNPLLHFIDQGWREGCNPNPDFDVNFYMKKYPDVVVSGGTPLSHYLETGNSAGYLTAPQKILLGYEEMKCSELVAKGSKQKFASPSLYEDLKKRIRNATSQAGTVPECIKIADDDLLKSMENLSFKFLGKPEVSIVIPVFNCLPLLTECLLSIEKYVQTPFEIVIADDCSDDIRIKTIFEHHQTIKYIRNEENIGFLRNVNNVMSYCSGKYIFLLNSDVQLLGDCVTVLLRHLKSDPDAMITGPKIIYPNGVLQEAGGCIHTDCASTMTGHGESAENPKYRFNRYVDYISGACLCFEKKTFVQLGHFNEEYSPAYVEDLEFCARVTRYGGKVLYVAETTIVHNLSASSKTVSENFKIYQSAVNKEKFKTEYQRFFKKKNRIKPIAFYLPQFHSIKQNSYWWGEGYTEWRAVANAQSLFKGHYQPHIPSDLGFYDLSTQSEIFKKQATLARRYGLHGFCFYYYNFSSFELLEKPLELFLQSKADINFCLCWANENWTRTWDGRDHDILCEQNGDAEGGFLNVIKGMERFILDHRYITVDKKPLVLIYRAELIENIKDVTRLWRHYWKEKYGNDLYLCLVDSMERSAGLSCPPEDLGFDAAVDFPVHHVTSSAVALADSEKLKSTQFDGALYDYSEAVVEICSKKHPGYKRFPGVFPSWDNTSRRGNKATIFRDAHPSSFQVFLENKCEEAKLYSLDERLLFINAWNEWGEGAHLEPDIEYGHTWLQVIEKTVRENQ